ncbi:GGDEF domain-containing protein [Haliovirga abyssi]|uniref:GGDEF domain-containing protein n=1 Tax=Haliovirga abyssi TaxID=2996794 RepID=A0AAU9DCN2_9FUSO|nr:GGDEF domain-containing protein [Haliovirga abyssi]BDU49913.1 hypothetical protein HLVA_04820 [Haliovirga abyssi]
MKFHLYKNEYRTILVISIISFIGMMLILMLHLKSMQESISIEESHYFEKIWDDYLKSDSEKTKNIKDDLRFFYFIRDGIYFNEKSKISKEAGKYKCFKFRIQKINRYRLESYLKSKYYKDDIYISVYNKNYKNIFTNSKIKYYDKFLKNLKFKNDFGVVKSFFIFNNEFYVRNYILSLDRNNIIVVDYKVSTSILEEFSNRYNVGLLIEDINNKKIVSSISKNVKYNKKNLKDKWNKGELLKIEGEWYFFKKVSIKNILKKEIGYFVIFDLKKDIKNMRYDLIMRTLIMLALIILVVIIINNANIKLIKDIKEILLYEDMNQNYLKTEGEGLLSIVKNYKNMRDNIEKIITEEVNKKTKEISEVNKELDIENNFLISLIKLKTVEEILYKSYEILHNNCNIKEIRFVSLLKGNEQAASCKIDQEGKIINETVFNREEGKFLEGNISNGSVMSFNLEKTGFVYNFFSTENISGAMLSIIYNYENEDKEKRIEEFASIIALTLKSAKLYEISITDPLTGVNNRSTMNFYLKKLFKKSNRYNKIFSLLMIDIDHFKRINDSYGHLTGDYVLKAITKEIDKVIRDVDSIFRYGGEEFLVAMPETEIKEAVIVADRIRENIEKSKIKLEKFVHEDIRITVSIGAVEYNDKFKTIKDVISESDKKMYEAKKSGRNNVKY